MLDQVCSAEVYLYLIQIKHIFNIDYSKLHDYFEQVGFKYILSVCLG